MKNTKKIVLGITFILLLSFAAFFLYVSDYYKADEYVGEVIATEQSLNITRDKNLTFFYPEEDTSSALIFYPGGKVDEMAYYPLLSSLSKKGITCVLVKMPFHLAVFDINAADAIYDKLPNIKNWYIGGHSLGGAMASSYAAKHPDTIHGLVLLGAYVYGDIDPSKAITIYGSNDMVLDKSKITDQMNVFLIEGGNHAYFGNYGEQKGDGVASITRQEQQNQCISAIFDFMSANRTP